jgi:hypothetical protein
MAIRRERREEGQRGGLRGGAVSRTQGGMKKASRLGAAGATARIELRTHIRSKSRGGTTRPIRNRIGSQRIRKVLLSGAAVFVQAVREDPIIAGGVPCLESE